MSDWFLNCDASTDVISWIEGGGPSNYAPGTPSGQSLYWLSIDNSTHVIAWRLGSTITGGGDYSTLICDDGTKVISWRADH